jgi:amidophosphoribosyltransferase
VEVIAKLINDGKTLIEAILAFREQIQGSASLLIMKEEGIYAVRDRLVSAWSLFVNGAGNSWR